MGSTHATAWNPASDELSSDQSPKRRRGVHASSLNFWATFVRFRLDSPVERRLSAFEARDVAGHCVGDVGGGPVGDACHTGRGHDVRFLARQIDWLANR